MGDETIPIELHAVNAWEATLGMASSFQQGRVFLAGDAAHVQSSAGGRWTLFAGPGDRRWPATAASLGIDPQLHELSTVDDAVLVRPDGFVAWRGATAESLREALRDVGLRHVRRDTAHRR
ncbi:FAD-dependent monooxygenase [Streptomyces sp. NPDC050485]|uniref:aromatic-ring hydroxylase C-terminal domain-containing protein n=1 Tax=Streptomyces sp. NPDC050485 TaxID=3365617 RepID=UPI0037BE1024